MASRTSGRAGRSRARAARSRPRQEGRVPAGQGEVGALGRAGQLGPDAGSCERVVAKHLAVDEHRRRASPRTGAAGGAGSNGAGAIPPGIARFQAVSPCRASRTGGTIPSLTRLSPNPTTAAPRRLRQVRAALRPGRGLDRREPDLVPRHRPLDRRHQREHADQPERPAPAAARLGAARGWSGSLVIGFLPWHPA